MKKEYKCILRKNISWVLSLDQENLTKKVDILLEQMKHNDLMNEKYKNTCKYLNYVEKLLILV